MLFFYILMALCAGLAMAIQAAINTQLANALHHEPVMGAFVSFFSGTIVLFFIALLKTSVFNQMCLVVQQPWWKLTGGILGAGIVFTVVFLAPKLGISSLLFLLMIGQLITASIIDHYGLLGMPVHEMQIGKIIGLLVIMIGLFVFFFADKYCS